MGVPQPGTSCQLSGWLFLNPVPVVCAGAIQYSPSYLGQWFWLGLVNTGPATQPAGAGQAPQPKFRLFLATRSQNNYLILVLALSSGGFCYISRYVGYMGQGFEAMSRWTLEWRLVESIFHSYSSRETLSHPLSKLDLHFFAFFWRGAWLYLNYFKLNQSNLI